MDRAVLYLRQSVTHDESISLELQENACRAYCTQRGYEVVASEADPGISGGTFNRPGVTKVMAMVEAKQADVIILWKWSRLSRRNVDWYAALDRVEKAGGRIESATEPIDLSTGIGEFSRDMLISFAAFERKRISETWKEVSARRIRNGLPHDGGPRHGYLRVGNGYVPDPVWGPVVAELYQRYNSGESTHALCRWLTAQGAITPRGNEWIPPTLMLSLDRGFPAGLIYAAGEFYPGAHEPLITPGVWDRYVQLRRDRVPIRGAWTKRKYLLTGLLHCALCIEDGHARATMYSHARPGYEPGTHWKCPRHLRVCAWEPVVKKMLYEFVADLTAGRNSEFQALLKPRAAPDTTKTKRDLLKTENDLLNIARKNTDGFYDDQTYLRLRAELLDKQRLLRKKLDEDTAPANADKILTALAGWHDLPVEVKRDSLDLILRRVIVRVNERPKYTLDPLWGVP